jgi:ABC-type transport system involved in cytochrome c biogenesis ATPase subunit
VCVCVCVCVRVLSCAASIGYCSSVNTFHFGLSVLENVLLYVVMKSLPLKCVEQQLRRFGLLDQKERNAKNLDASSQRLLSLAIASLGSPRILLIDSPTAGEHASTQASCCAWGRIWPTCTRDVCRNGPVIASVSVERTWQVEMFVHADRDRIVRRVQGAVYADVCDG